MSISKRFGLAAALEEIENEQQVETPSDVPAQPPVDETPPVVDEPVEIPVAEETPEEAIAQAEMAESDIEQADETIETASEDAQALSDIADTIENSEAVGGMDSASAAIAQVAVERLMERLSLGGHKAIPALEAFGGDSSRIKSTKLAVENIREQVKNVIQAIIAMVKKAYEFVKNYIKSILVASERMKARAEKLQAALDKVSGSSKQEKISGDFVKSLIIGDGVDAQKALEATSNLLDAGAGLTADMFGSIKPADIVDIINNEDKYKSFEFRGFGGEKLEKFSEKDENGFIAYKIVDTALPGGIQMTIKMKSDAQAGAESFEALVATSFDMVNGEAKDITEAKTLTIEEAKAVVKAAIDQLDKMAGLKEQADNVEKYLAEMAGEVKKLKADKEDQAKSERIKLGAKVLKSMSSLSVSPFVKSSKLSINTVKAALEYAAQSAKTYGADVPEGSKPEGGEEGNKE